MMRFFISACLSFATFASAIAAPNFTYQASDQPADGFDHLIMPIRILDLPEDTTGYYWATQANFIADGHSAIYMGLQPRTRAQKNRVVFSVFGEGTSPLAPSCHGGADGGSGTSCMIVMDWAPHRLYELDMQRVRIAGDLQIWEGAILDKEANAKTLIGRFSVPAARKGLGKTLDAFDEYFPFNGATKNTAERPCIPYAVHEIGAPLMGQGGKLESTRKMAVGAPWIGDSCAVKAHRPPYDYREEGDKIIIVDGVLNKK